MKLLWDNCHKQTREGILSNACINTRFANYEWDELEEWLKVLIQDNLLLRSGGLVSIS